MKVEKRHAIIRREGGRYLLVNNQSPPEYTLVNDRPVPGVVELHDGDRIRLGNVVLKFQMREARATKGPPPRPPVIAPVARR
jgi:pSer/pThr/pTyr-binding forkhead associated (FHA) protein